MDFFEAQVRARKRTSRFVALFAVALLGTILAGYFPAIWVQGELDDSTGGQSWPRPAFAGDGRAGLALWQPRIFLGVTVGTLLVVGLASLYKWNEFRGGGSAVAESVGGRRINPHSTHLHERRLLNVVEEMAIAAGLPVPAVYLLDDEPAINAFAAGLTTNDAVVAVTRGTLEKLTRDELQGVVGHEFSHILNGDMRLNMRLSALVFGILVIGLAGRGVLSSFRIVRLRSRDNKNSAGVLVAIAVAGLTLMLIGYVGYFFGRLIQAAVSRQREFLADASAIQFTRNPIGLSGALKKIGGFALGSSLASNKSTALGHFFFAQGFRSMFGGLWATHPPLQERLLAIDGNFDGKMFEPPEVVDVARESFVSAGLAPRSRTPAQDIPAPPRSTTTSRTAGVSSDALSAIESIGTLSSAQINHARLLLESIPPRLRAAAHDPHGAAVLLYGLLLQDEPELRARQRSLVAGRAGAEALRSLDDLRGDLQTVAPEQKLPLLQLALPTLKTLSTSALTPILDTLDELVHADRQVSILEFTLQKLLIHTLALGRAPGASVVQFYSFNAVVAEIAVVLSALAIASTHDITAATAAFAAGSSSLKRLEKPLTPRLVAPVDFAALDVALDRLTAASLPIKQQTLLACALVVSADHQIRIGEAELLRAISATLDCPMPPLPNSIR